MLTLPTGNQELLEIPGSIPEVSASKGRCSVSQACLPQVENIGFGENPEKSNGETGAVVLPNQLSELPKPRVGGQALKHHPEQYPKAWQLQEGRGESDHEDGMDSRSQPWR